MASLLNDYEQQYGILTADITSKIGQLSSCYGAEKKSFAQDVDKQLDEVQELIIYKGRLRATERPLELEQMELEMREVEASLRPRLKTRIDSYKAELTRLSLEFKRAKSTNLSQDGLSNQSDMYGEISLKEGQKQRLLDNSERLERTGHHLTSGYHILMETEEVGSQVLRDLHTQRETVQKSRARLRDTNAELNRSSRIINAMITRSLQHRFILLCVALTFCIVIICSIYYSATKNT